MKFPRMRLTLASLALVVASSGCATTGYSSAGNTDQQSYTSTASNDDGWAQRQQAADTQAMVDQINATAAAQAATQQAIAQQITDQTNATAAAQTQAAIAAAFQ